MLKQILIMIGLLCIYLSSIIVLHRFGVEEMLNVTVSSFLLGIALKLWVPHYFYLMLSLVLLVLPFLLIEQYKMLEMMLMTTLLGITLTHLFQSRKKYQLKSESYKSL